ncbi:hypothetical protein SISSUDRAFT_1066414 [Sistotremastrum suecicum HHB10207 ss-3]|uniref:WD40 repeat-like protein n=1 Tax=Sistotremastrum suecicum HHB10207 ss-3 TaxID=1314776 RepID=A0A165YCP8_9AGAM|nr:hypothetical protein SISSUDRAFT_1066414 [Sistotremastrum suecicum HHB10207 ss-3]
MAQSASTAAQIKDWTLGFRVSHIVPQAQNVASVSLSPDGRYIATCDTAGNLDVYTVGTGRKILNLAQTIPVLADRGVDRYCWAQPYITPFNIGLSAGPMWTAAAPIEAHKRVTSMCIDKTNNYVCTVSAESIRLWRIDDDWNLKLLAVEDLEYERNHRILKGAFFCGSLLYYPIGPKLVRVWETEQRVLEHRRDLPVFYEIGETFVSPNEEYLIALNPTGGGHLYLLPDLDYSYVALGKTEMVQSVSFVEGRSAFLYGDSSGNIRMRSWGSSATLLVLPHHIRRAVAGIVDSRTVDGITIIASATSRSATFDQPTLKIWTDSPSIAPAPARSDFQTELLPIFFRALLRLLLFAVWSRFLYDLGKLVERENADYNKLVGFRSHLDFSVCTILKLYHEYSTVWPVGILLVVGWVTVTRVERRRSR